MKTPTESIVPRAPALKSPEFGLALGLVVGRFAVGMRDLHYGYWTDDLPITPENLPVAQARYTEELMHDIPDGVKSILDVGCGAGNTARKLLDLGYEVVCLSPNPWLNVEAQAAVGGRAKVHLSTFEEFRLDQKFDLILFSESFLFMKPDVALARAEAMLNPGGYVLIADIFRASPDGTSPIGGGQDLRHYQALMAASRFEMVKDTDLTARIAPTFDLISLAYQQAIMPAYALILARLEAANPWVMKFVRWKWRRKIQRLEEKHFTGRRTGAHFCRYKNYRRTLYRLPH